MRKPNFLIVLAVFSMVLFPSAALASEYNFAAISVSALRYEPFPAQPGTYLKVWLNVENVGTEAAENLQVMLDPEYPFTLDESQDAVQDIGTLEGKESTYIDYKLRVAEDAVEGTADLKVRYTLGSGGTWVEKTVSIELRTLDVDLDIESTISGPTPPGGTTPLEIVLKNAGNTTLQDISVQLDIVDLPFYPINSTAQKKIYLMRGGETNTLKYYLMASPSADCQPYKIPIDLSYKTLDGTQYTKTDYITLVVCAEPEIVVDLDSSDIRMRGTKGTVTVNIINKGLSDVKFLTLSLELGEYEVISSSMVYIGNLDSDDFDTAEYDLFVNGALEENGQVPLNFNVTYRDGNNNLHSETQVVALSLYTPEELDRYGLVPSQSNTGLIIVLLLVVLAVYWWRKRRKKRK